MRLRRRVLGYTALAAVLSCALTVAVAVALVRHRIAAQRVVAMQAQASLLAVAGGAPGALRAGDHVYRIGSGRPRRVRPLVAQRVLAAIPPSGDAQGTVDVAGRSLLYVARTSATGRIVLVRGARLAFGEWRPFLVSLVLAGAGGALLAALLAAALARRLTRPIAALAGATHRLAAGEAGVEVPIDPTAELADLGHSFNAMSAELERAREAQRTFLESVSHELKTPLTSIRGYAEALTDGAVAAGEGGEVIAAEAGRLERLVSDLLDLARLGRADFAVERRPVDLAAVADAVVRRHRPRAAELGVALRSAAPPEPCGALGDEGRLLQAASNLVENALRLTPPGGEVTVTAGPGALIVEDAGPGLAAEDLPRAFERFYLHDRYRSERPVGSGLGLAIVKELAAAMGGTVTAAGRPGGGARFQIALPRTEALTPPLPAVTGGSPPCA